MMSFEFYLYKKHAETYETGKLAFCLNDADLMLDQSHISLSKCDYYFSCIVKNKEKKRKKINTTVSSDKS